MAIQNFKTEAIILATTDVFDADRSYLLFTREYGKLRARGKGVRRPTSRLTGHLLPFLPTQLELVPAGGWHLITQAHIVERGVYPENSIDYLRQAELLAEGIDRLLEEGTSHPHLYDGLVYSLERLREGRHPLLVVAEYFLKCMVTMGYHPELTRSVIGGGTLQPDSLLWSSMLGGVGNRPEFAGVEGAGVVFPISSQTIVALRQLVRPQFLAEKIAMPDDVRSEVVRIVFDYVQTQIGKPLRAWQFSLTSGSMEQ